MFILYFDTIDWACGKIESGVAATPPKMNQRTCLEVRSFQAGCKAHIIHRLRRAITVRQEPDAPP
jgi:hypothetical protein